MKKARGTLLSFMAFVGLAAGTTAISTASMWLFHQPKCPDELLK